MLDHTLVSPGKGMGHYPISDMEYSCKFYKGKQFFFLGTDINKELLGKTCCQQKPNVNLLPVITLITSLCLHRE